MKALHHLAHVLKKQAQAEQQKGNHGKAAGLSAAAAVTALLTLQRYLRFGGARRRDWMAA